MKLTWMDTFKIIQEMFDLNANDIARYLGVNKSTISRLKSGESKQFKSFDKAIMNEEIYSRLFDPNNGPLKESEKLLWSIIRDTIDKLCFREVMEDLWGNEDNYKSGDYKIFVFKMLERTSSNQPLTIFDLEQYLFSTMPDYAAQRTKERFRMKW